MRTSLEWPISLLDRRAIALIIQGDGRKKLYGDCAVISLDLSDPVQVNVDIESEQEIPVGDSLLPMCTVSGCIPVVNMTLKSMAMGLDWLSCWPFDFHCSV